MQNMNIWNIFVELLRLAKQKLLELLQNYLILKRVKRFQMILKLGSDCLTVFIKIMKQVCFCFQKPF